MHQCQGSVWYHFDAGVMFGFHIFFKAALFSSLRLAIKGLRPTRISPIFGSKLPFTSASQRLWASPNCLSSMAGLNVCLFICDSRLLKSLSLTALVNLRNGHLLIWDLCLICPTDSWELSKKNYGGLVGQWIVTSEFTEDVMITREKDSTRQWKDFERGQHCDLNCGQARDGGLSASQLSCWSSLSKFGQDPVGGCKLKQTHHMFVNTKRRQVSIWEGKSNKQHAGWTLLN